MLAIDPKPPSRKVIPNILPCAIKHNGAIKISQRHWSPTTATNTNDNDDGPSTAYFRGRKLHGRAVQLPAGYRGVVLSKTDQLLPRGPPTVEQLRRMEEADDEEDEELESQPPVDVKMMEPMAAFDQIMVWGHEAVAQDDDEYVKGIEEWIGLAAVIHASNDHPTDRKDQ